MSNPALLRPRPRPPAGRGDSKIRRPRAPLRRCVPARVTRTRKQMSLAFKSTARVRPSSASYEQALRCSTAAWPAAPGGHRRVKGSAARAEEPAGHAIGDTSFIYRRSRPPVNVQALQNTENKEKVIDAVHPGRPAGWTQPGRSAVVLLHVCQQSNTCQETSPRPGLTTRPLHCAHTNPLTSLHPTRERARARRALFYREASPSLLILPNRIGIQGHVLIWLLLRARVGGAA